MDCAEYREAISAGVDGELTPLEAQAVDHHLQVCAACRSWAEGVEALARWSRLVTVAGEPPDLSATILLAVDDQARRRMARPATANPAARTRLEGWTRWVGSSMGVARVGLALVGLLQLCFAVPGLLGDDGGAPIHIAREQGCWGAALAFAFLVVACRPGHATGLLPFVAALALGLATTAVLDIAAGDTSSVREVSHVAAVLGVILLWSIKSVTVPGLSRRTGRTTSARPA